MSLTFVASLVPFYQCVCRLTSFLKQSGHPPWKTRSPVSRLDNLQRDIADGTVKVDIGGATNRHTETLRIISKE